LDLCRFVQKTDRELIEAEGLWYRSQLALKVGGAAQQCRIWRRRYLRIEEWQDALLEVALAPYWHRLWIVQEVALARIAKVVTSTGTVDIRDVNNLFLVLEAISESYNHMSSAISGDTTG
jgi:hypothetical protein